MELTTITPILPIRKKIIKLRCFILKIDLKSDFYEEVPFYQLQIYFIKKWFEQILTKGPALVEYYTKDKKKTVSLRVS